MAKSQYLTKVKLCDFQKCMDQIDPHVRSGDFDQAFEILEEYRIGSQTTNPSGRTFAYWLIEGERGRARNEEERLNYVEFFKRFFDKGVEIDHQDKKGLTLLTWSVFTYCEEICLFLLDRGANPNIADMFKRTPLYYASSGMFTCNDTERQWQIYPTVVPALLKAGADPFFPYPTVEEAKDNKRYEWALHKRFGGIVYVNLYEEMDKWRERAKDNPRVKEHLDIFFNTIIEVSAKKSVDE